MQPLPLWLLQHISQSCNHFACSVVRFHICYRCMIQWSYVTVRRTILYNSWIFCSFQPRPSSLVEAYELFHHALGAAHSIHPLACITPCDNFEALLHLCRRHLRCGTQRHASRPPHPRASRANSNNCSPHRQLCYVWSSSSVKLARRLRLMISVRCEINGRVIRCPVA